MHFLLDACCARLIFMPRGGSALACAWLPQCAPRLAHVPRMNVQRIQQKAAPQANSSRLQSAVKRRGRSSIIQGKQCTGLAVRGEGASFWGKGGRAHAASGARAGTGTRRRCVIYTARSSRVCEPAAHLVVFWAQPGLTKKASCGQGTCTPRGRSVQGPSSCCRPSTKQNGGAACC